MSIEVPSPYGVHTADNGDIFITQRDGDKRAYIQFVDPDAAEAVGKQLLADVQTARDRKATRQ